MTTALVVLGIVNLVLLVFLLVRSNGTGLEALRADMAERLARSAAETQTKIGDRVATSLAESRREHDTKLAALQQAVQSELQGGRGDVSSLLTGLVTAQTNALNAFQESMEKRFELIRERTDQRLGEIGQQVQLKLDQNIQEGFRHFGEVQKSLRATEEQLLGLKEVGSSITELNSLLKLPHLRGGFGEAVLERLLADFLPTTMYELQVQIGTSPERVDAIVRFPNHILPIDSKFPREQVLGLFEADDPAQLAEARKTLSRVVRDQARSITKYISLEAGTTDMALMFLPSETLYFEVLRDTDLWGALMKLKVFPVSPNTLAVTLQAIKLAYKSYQMRVDVEAILSQVQKTRRHFEQFSTRFEDVGESLEKARKAFDTAGTHLRNYSASVDRLTGESGGEQMALPGAAGS